MKFKKLYEEYTSDDLYQELIDYIYEKLLVAVDNLAMQAASDIAEYDPDYCSEEPNNYSMEADNKLRQAAEYFAEFLLKEAPEVIHEDLKEDFDGKIIEQGKVEVLKPILYSSIKLEIDESDEFNSKEKVIKYFSNDLFTIKNNGNIYLNPGKYKYIVRNEPNVLFNFSINGNEYPFIDWDNEASTMFKFYDNKKGLKEASEIIHEDVKGRPSGSKNRMRLEIAGEPYSAIYAKQKNGIKNALYGQNIKDIIRSIDDDHSDDYFDYGWEDDDDIGAEYGLYINKKPFGYSSNRGELIRIDSRYINNVNELLNYISKAFSYVNEGRYDRAAIVTPRGNILVDYGASNVFEESLKEEIL